MKKIGFISEGEGVSRFDSFRGYFANNYNENFPDGSRSPNYPRAKGRVPGYRNPLLGDAGWGEIARWQTIKQSAVETIIDQMIEQFLMNKDWYSSTRCTESLWNMYRRIEWWVRQNTEPGDSEYEIALSFIRDCIEKVLDNGDRPEISKLVDFTQGMDGSISYTGNWVFDMGSLYIDSKEGETNSISTSYKYNTKGLLIFNIATDLDEGSKVVFTIDGEEKWMFDTKGYETDFAFRDIVFNMGAGAYDLKWEVIGGGKVRFKNIKFIELNPAEGVDSLPNRPKPYTFHHTIDYTNHFDGSTVERPLFFPNKLEKVSDFTDLLRYVSSTEDIEWIQVKSVGGDEQTGNENIYKLPLDRVPETLSSKITLDWRFKKKGYIEFKYLVDSSEKSSLSFWINNNKVGGEWYKTDGWQTARYYVSQGQTYKFDFIVHKEVAMDLGLNAVYLKDIRCVETTPYDMTPAPMDYAKHQENIENKWKIYSDDGVMASYYRGFTDGDNDRERVVEMELFSECDGWVSFDYRLGTDIPDRDFVSSTVLQDNITKLQECTTIKLIESRDSSVTICPEYSDMWDNNEGAYSTEGDGEVIRYTVNKDNDVDLNFKAYFGNKCPPVVVAKYDDDIVHTSIQGVGEISGEGNWSANGDCLVYTSGENERKNGFISVLTDKGGELCLNFEGWLDDDEVLNVYNNGYFETAISSSMLLNQSIQIPLADGVNLLEFEIDQYGYGEIDRLYYRGNIELESSNDDYYLHEDMPIDRLSDEISEVYRWRVPNGRRIEFSDIRGALIGDGDWLSGGADGDVVGKFKVRIDKDSEFILKLPFNNVAYTDLDELEALIGGLNYNILLYDDVNDESRWGTDPPDVENFDLSSSWQWVNIFERFGNPSYGVDGVIIVDEPNIVGDGVHSIVIDNLQDLGLEDGRGLLSFQYGALFKNNDNFSVYANVGGEDVKIFHSVKSYLGLDGINIINLAIPDGTSYIRFEYVQCD